MKTFRALLYVDDTLLCEEHVGKVESLLWAVEDVSRVFGLKLNKKKCIQMSIGHTMPIKFKDDTEIQQVTTAEYLGSVFNDEADPRTEIKSRLNIAARSRYRLQELWSKAKLDHLEKILIYEALIKAKMTYALDVLPIPQAEYDRLDAEYLRGYRQIFGLKTTYGQQSLGDQRASTYEQVMGLINEALSKTKKQRQFTPISKVIKERAKQKLGDALRRDWKDPVGQVVRGVHSTRARPCNFTLPGECLP